MYGMYKRMSLPSLSVAPTIVAELLFTKNKPDEGDETAAVCEWAGSPTPEVTWLKDGEPLDEETLPSRIRIVSTDDFRSELQIREVELNDAGNYACNVTNPVGFDFQRKSLEVQGVCVCVCVCVLFTFTLLFFYGCDMVLIEIFRGG